MRMASERKNKLGRASLNTLYDLSAAKNFPHLKEQKKRTDIKCGTKLLNKSVQIVCWIWASG